MYNCENCNKTIGPNLRMNKVVVQYRKWQHPFRSGVCKVKREDGKVEWLPDQGGTGLQIAKELCVCDSCRQALELKLSEQK
jgi:hypothetical protein